MGIKIPLWTWLTGNELASFIGFGHLVYTHQVVDYIRVSKPT